ncbi:hypothetical protein [Reichenbachiella ulvae]|uniref:DMSO/TMAO reductase YedYZ, heme-binding membrane subunit n=1 Tax=Reichenbachiella ulvae TaxID=2980104 RepID=A0ABT3CZ10_9BACT|nr:hypothetical protein [Reichenbachiella ulvae]MCV9388932.1 hypothetical protein [Reichenbachiella ulvae]
MVRQWWIIVLIILVLEAAIYGLSGLATDDWGIQFQLAARYSARVSLLIFIALFAWVAREGLKSLFQSEQKRSIINAGVFAFAFNHLLHLLFLIITHYLLGWELFTLKTSGGILVYILVLLAPWYLQKKTHLTSASYRWIYGSFSGACLVFFVSYLGRWNKELPFISSKAYFIGSMIVIAGLFLVNMFRIWQERSVKLEVNAKNE